MKIRHYDERAQHPLLCFIRHHVDFCSMRTNSRTISVDTFTSLYRLLIWKSFFSLSCFSLAVRRCDHENNFSPKKFNEYTMCLYIISRLMMRMRKTSSGFRPQKNSNHHWKTTNSHFTHFRMLAVYLMFILPRRSQTGESSRTGLLFVNATKCTQSQWRRSVEMSTSLECLSDLTMLERTGHCLDALVFFACPFSL